MEFLFGVIDNGVLLICMAFGCEIEDYLPIPKRFRSKASGAAIGALVGNAISDFVAGLPQGIDFALQVGAGCLVVLVALPLVLIRTKN